MVKDNFLKLVITFNRIMGALPFETTKPWTKRLNKCYQLFMLFGLGLTMFLNYFWELFSLRNVEDVSENLRLTGTITVSCWKSYLVNSHLCRTMIERIRESEQLIITSNNAHQMRLLKMHKARLRFVVWIYVVLATIINVLMDINALIEGVVNGPVPRTISVDNATVYVPRALPWTGRYPFDKYKHYNWTFLYQFFAGHYISNVTIAVDLFFWAMMRFSVVNLQTLQYKVRNFKKLALKAEDLEDGLSVHEKTRKYIHQRIDDHREIIKFVEDIDGCIKWVMFVDSGMATVQIAMILIGLILNDMSIGQVDHMLYALWKILQILTAFYTANEISLEVTQESSLAYKYTNRNVFCQSAKLADAIFESEWFECPIDIQKDMAFMLLRAQKPLVLNVGPLFTMNTATSISILKTAFSYFALIRQMYL